MPDDIIRSKRFDPFKFSASSSSSLDAVLDNGNDAALRQLIHSLFSAGEMLRECRGIMGEQIGLTGRQYQILMAIARLQNSRGVQIKELALELRVVQSHVTVEVGKLVGRGYLEKLPNAADRRSVLVALTAEGCRLIEDVTPMVRDINDDLFAGLTRDEFLTFKAILKKFVANAEGAVSTARYRIEMTQTNIQAGE